jgi:hypothetical protein
VPILAFFDDDEAIAPEERPPTRRSGSSGGSPFLVRRLVGVGLLIVILVLLLLGIRGCLDARAERGLENYVSDMSTIVRDYDQLSANFFEEHLSNPGEDAGAFEQQIAADRGTAESLLSRAEGLDVPGDLEQEHAQMLQAFQLRATGMTGISNQIATALGDNARQAQQATDAIAGYMRWFLASDVLYGIAHDEANTLLEDEDIDGRLPGSRFLPDPPDQWIDADQLSSTLAGVAGSTQQAAPGLHGTELVSSAINGIALTPGAAATVGGGAPYTLTLEVLNGGEHPEQVSVEYRFRQGISGEGTEEIGRIAAGETQSVDVELRGVRPGDSGELEVNLPAVPGETFTDNNMASYTVTFE